MKAIYRTILAAAAAIMALNSCVVDNVIPDRETVNKTDGSRIISISFGSGTKTVLDGFQPKFAEGDTIKVSNGVSAPEIRLVKVDAQGNAYFTTDLMGALKAVYPASAAELKKNDKQIDTIYGVKVPDTQSGRFADANICTADIQDAATTATFENQVAILKFYVDKSIGVKSIKVTSDSELATGSQKSLTIDPDADATINTITDDPQKRICYVAVLPGQKESLKFTSETTTQGSVERIFTADVALDKNGMYNAFIPYYIDLGKAGKWAYCNIGAFLPEEPGKYFAWGDTKGQNWNGSWSDEFKTIEGNPDTLKLANDAAHVIWGGSWRMPTKAQLDTLAAATKEWSTEAKGYKLYTASADTSIFLPAAGSSEDMSKAGTSGEYWSSSLNTEEKTLAYKLGTCNESATTATMSRTVGATIRPFRHIPVDRIELNKTKDTVKINDVATLIATVYPANASDTLVTWTSSNTAVATVERGIVTGKAGGTATITARIIDLDGTEKSATCEVKVPAKVESVSLNKSKIDALNVGSTETLTATISPSANTIIVSTTWSSDATSIATVDNNGKVTGVAAPGTATIKVTVKDVYDNEVTKTCSVTVKPNAPEGAISGKFSVRADLQVFFSKGNLRYTITNSTWSFFNNQYDYDSNDSSKKADHQEISLFSWGYDPVESVQVGGYSGVEGPEDGGEFDYTEDWGYVFGGDTSIWRTLTFEEWKYLFGDSEERKDKYKLQVTICEKNSRYIVIAPDDWDLTANPLKDSYNATEWAAAEANGLVCLPPAGNRSNSTFSFSKIGESGSYWSSTARNSSFTKSIAFGKNLNFYETHQNCQRNDRGFSVRLVTDVPTN